ncbi:unnamed protein product [Symbiodinium sp. CCMP2592]|nr:unnamed protein product [Symbiodinium sp. CCMP2592]
MRTSMLGRKLHWILRCTAASMQTSRSQVSSAAAPTGAGAECWFGRKHFGRPLSQVAEEDPSYCRWLLRKAKAADAPSSLQENAAWLRSHAPDIGAKRHAETAKQGTCVPAENGGQPGRMQYGRDLSDLAQEDPVYCQWMLREAKEPHASPKLRENANWLLENAPHLQEQGLLVTGGKHRGKKMSELLAEDSSYCHWILREAQEPSATRGMKDMAEWLTENAPHLQEDGVLAAGGRHKGRLLSDLVVDDPTYCQWILRTAQEEQSSGGHLRAQAAWLQKNAPHLKEVPVVSLRSAHKGVPVPQVVAEDPRWCSFVLRQEEARSRGFAIAAEWLREKAPELLEAQDDAEIAQIGQKFFKQYGQHFVVRSGKHRMKTFAVVVKDDPKFVEWALQQSTSDAGCNKNIQFFAAFVSQQSSQETADSFKREAVTFHKKVRHVRARKTAESSAA